MDEQQRLNDERIELERELLVAEQELAQQRSMALPDAILMHCTTERIDTYLARLKPVNDELARLPRPRN